MVENGFKAVSYTHLDVYKRQEYMSVNSKDSKIKILSAETNDPSLIKNLLISVKDDKDLVYTCFLYPFRCVQEPGC